MMFGALLQQQREKEKAVQAAQKRNKDEREAVASALKDPNF